MNSTARKRGRQAERRSTRERWRSRMYSRPPAAEIETSQDAELGIAHNRLQAHLAAQKTAPDHRRQRGPSDAALFSANFSSFVWLVVPNRAYSLGPALIRTGALNSPCSANVQHRRDLRSAIQVFPSIIALSSPPSASHRSDFARTGLSDLLSVRRDSSWRFPRLLSVPARRRSAYSAPRLSADRTLELHRTSSR